jgi:hypothetical protein
MSRNGPPPNIPNREHRPTPPPPPAKYVVRDEQPKADECDCSGTGFWGFVAGMLLG